MADYGPNAAVSTTRPRELTRRSVIGPGEAKPYLHNGTVTLTLKGLCSSPSAVGTDVV